MSKNWKKISVIGSGFWGLATALFLAKKWHNVTVYEKNEQLWWRASVFETWGFRRDMWPSRYLMPDIFEQFFELMWEDINDHLNLTKLAPSYRLFFEWRKEWVDIYSDITKNKDVLEQFEPNALEKLERYMEDATYKYETSMKDFVWKRYESVWDFFQRKLLREWMRLNIFNSMRSFVDRYFESNEMKQLVQYTLLFLGTAPKDAPALYSLMAHVDFGKNMGVFYPQWWINAVIQALVKIWKNLWVTFHTDSEVTKITTIKDPGSPERLYGDAGSRATWVIVNGVHHHADIVISNADMRWTETQLLNISEQTYPQSYRDRKVFAPSGFVIYAWLSKKLKNIKHHSLRFWKDWSTNFWHIFDTKTIPPNPSRYICCPSQTDPSVAPEGKENIFILVPFPPGLFLTEEEKADYRLLVWKNIEETLGEEILPYIEQERLFGNKEFLERYNSYWGTALWIAHTLFQSALWRPKHHSSKVEWLYYCWSYTNPGIGMPMCLISGVLCGEKIMEDEEKNT